MPGSSLHRAMILALIFLAYFSIHNTLEAQSQHEETRWEIAYSEGEDVPSDNWISFEEGTILPTQTTVWFRTQFVNNTSDTISRVLFLNSAQRTKVILRHRGLNIGSPLITGTILPLSELKMPNGVIVTGIGNSAQEWVHFPPGDAELLIR